MGGRRHDTRSNGVPGRGTRSCSRNVFGGGMLREKGWPIAAGSETRPSKTATGVALAAENNHLGEGEVVGMRDRDERRKAAHRGETPRGAAVQLELRRSAAPDNFNIAPKDPMGMAGTERLHRRLFRGKPAGKMNRRHLATRAVRD